MSLERAALCLGAGVLIVAGAASGAAHDRAADQAIMVMFSSEPMDPSTGIKVTEYLAADDFQVATTGEATTCLGRQSASLGRTLVTHAIRHAGRTPLQYLFARVPTRDTLMVGVLESVGYHEVGVIPPAEKAPARPEQIEFVYVVEG